ncbi:hypothetical protein OPV22_006171 [Ensete ventricosum]|uniref:RING-type domain-containing protein n=1 Tax=Ensete ventricosum TaxID=4639 RepID=A0AAV8REH1_ENSVE|nr:hypothetical protein OPV22_006171 [Ensete ventricosum]
MDFPRAAPGFIDPSALLLANGAAPNPRKRGRGGIAFPETAPPPPPQQLQENHPVDLLSLQPQRTSAPLGSFAQHQSLPSLLVSTGLRLSFKDRCQQQNQKQSNALLSSSSSFLSSLLSEELTTHINQQKGEIEQFLHVEAEKLRRGLAERRRRHYRYLLSAANESAARRLREEEAEAERAARRSAELEGRLARLRIELMAWKAKATADQATAASLQAQLQQAAAAAAQARGGEASPTEDAESTFMDPHRVEQGRACRACRERLASVVLLPCRHLCLCDACDGGGGPVESCPVCGCVKAGSVRVYLT